MTITVMQPVTEGSGERQRERKRARAVADGANTCDKIEKETIADQRLPGREGAIGERQPQHQKGLNRKRDMKKWLAEKEAEGKEVEVDEAVEEADERALVWCHSVVLLFRRRRVETEK